MLLLAGLIVTMGAMAYFQIRSTEVIIKESMVRSNGRYLSTRIRIESLFLSDIILQYVISEDNDERVRLRVIFEESSRRIDELFRQAINAFEGKELKTVSRVQSQVRNFLNEALVVMNTHDQEGGYGVRSKMVLKHTSVLRGPMLDEVRSLEDIETENLDKARRQAKFVADKSTWMIVLAGGSILFLALFVIYLNIQRIFFPLIEIQRAVESVASGKLDHPIHSTRQDEFGVLAQAFNYMMSQLRGLISGLEQRVAHRTEQLSDSNKKLQEEIIERKKTEQDLLKAFNELKSVQRQLVQSEKMATVGQLATGVVHEINNPVAFLIGNMYMLHQYIHIFSRIIDKYEALEKLSFQDVKQFKQMTDEIGVYKKEVDLDIVLKDSVKLLEEMDEGFERIRKIIVDLKTFAHSDNLLKEKADINSLIDAALNIAKNELKYKVDIIKNYSNLPPAYCYPQQLSQVFINLLVNAAQAIQEKGTITIKTTHLSNEVLIEVADNGSGMTEDVLTHLFEPFFTTKPPGMGTGLGLSISYSIIEKHKGTISVKSTLGQGTVFSIKIPAGSEV
ncbi:MAG: ATP-binding protein [Candidatus Omnitrophota bacterium]